MSESNFEITKPNQDALIQALEWGYQKAVDGVPGLDSAVEMAEDYLIRQGDPVFDLSCVS